MKPYKYVKNPRYRGNSRATRLKIERLQRSVSKFEDWMALVKLSDFINGVMGLRTQEQVKLLKHLRECVLSDERVIRNEDQDTASEVGKP